MKRALTKLGWTVFALVALAVDIIAVLHLPEGQEFARFMVEKGIGERFKGEVKVGSLDIDLSGALSVEDIRFLSDSDELLHIDKVRVELDGLPDNDELDIALIEVSGVNVRQGEGLPRLESLFIPPDKDEVPSVEDASLNIRAIRVSDVNVEDLRPDGMLVQVSGLHLTGEAGVNSGKASFDFQIPAGSSRAKVTRPDGGVFKLPDLKLTFRGEANLVEQAVTLHLPAQKMPLYIQVPDLEILEDVLALESLDARLHPERAEVDLKGLKVADLTLDHLLAKFRIGPDRKLIGEQALKLDGLTISRRIINQATGRDSVDGPVRVNLEGRGPAEKVRVNGELQASRGVMKLKGLLNLSRPTHPSYELNLSGSELAGDEARDPASSDADVEVAVVGQGVLPGETNATLTMKVNTRRFGLPVDELRITGKTDGNAMDLNIDVLDERMTVRAKRNPEDNSFTMRLSTGAELTALLGKLQKAGLFNPPPVPLFGDDLSVDIRATGDLPDGSTLIPKVTIEGDVSAKGIRTGPNSIEFVTLKTNLEIVGGKPKGTIDLRLDGVVAGLIRFNAVNFRLTMDGTAYVMDGSVVGPKDEKIASFRAHGEVDLVKKIVSATLDTLTVHHEALEVSLAKPVTLSLPAGLELTKAPLIIPPIRLRVGDGWIDAEGALHFESIRMEGQEHEVLVLSDSDLSLNLHQVAPVLPATPKTRMMAKLKPKLSGSVRLRGRPDKPRATLNLTTDLGRYQITSNGTLNARKVKLEAALAPKRGKRLGTFQFEAPITPNKAQPLGPISLDWQLQRLPLAHFIDLAQAGMAKDVHLRGSGSVQGTLDSPEGEWTVALAGSKGHKVPAFEIRSSGQLQSRRGGVTVRINNEKRIQGLPTLESAVNLRFARSPLTHPQTKVTGDFTLTPIELAKITASDLSGRLGLVGSFEKRGRTLRAEANIEGSRLKHPKLSRPVDVLARLNLDKSGAVVTGTVSGGGMNLMELKGGLTGNIERAVRRKREGKLPLSLIFETPRTSMEALRTLIPSLPKLDGAIAGGMKITGIVADPKIEGAWEWSDFKVASGDDGRVELTLEGNSEGTDVALRVGNNSPLSLSAHVGQMEGSKLRVTSRLRAKNVRVDQLVPASVIPASNDALGGTLDGEFTFGYHVDPLKQTVEVQEATGSMGIDLKNMPIANTGRVFNQVHATLRAEKDGLNIGPLNIVESDVQESERRLNLSGKLVWDGFKPTHFKGEMSLRKWLGGGPLYAPHAQLDADIALSAVLDRPVPSLLVDFRSFRFEGPKRFLRDHYQEVFGHNDVVYIDD